MMRQLITRTNHISQTQAYFNNMPGFTRSNSAFGEDAFVCEWNTEGQKPDIGRRLQC